MEKNNQSTLLAVIAIVLFLGIAGYFLISQDYKTITVDITPEVRTQLEQQISDLKADLDEDPQNFKAYTNLASAYRTLGELGRAEEVYKEAAERNPESGQIYSNLGDLYLQMKDYARAENAFRDALVRAPREASYHLQLIDLYQYEYSDVEGALALAEDAVVKTENSTETLFRVAQLYEEVGKLREAINFYEAVLATSPDDQVLKNKLIQLQLRYNEQ